MRTRTVIVASLVSLGLMGMHDSLRAGQSAPATAPSGVEMRGSKRIVRLPEVPVVLPEAPGREVVMVSCGMCHTPAYITIQPPFPRETWVNEVTKMRKTFSAPIAEEKVDEIVNYLVAVRGAGKK